MSSTLLPVPATVAVGDRLSAAEQRQLFERWQIGGDRAARDRLVERYMPLARKLARRYLGAGEPLEDLVQVASVALVKAVDRFEATRGQAFTSFAVPTILGELRRYFRDTGWGVHVPRGAQELALRVERAIKEMNAGSGREPTPQTIAEYMECSVDEVLEGLEARAGHHSTSLDAPSHDDDDGGSMHDAFGSLDDAYEMVEARLALAQSMRSLPVQTREMIRLRFEEELTQSEIGERLGVSQMRVSRMLRAALIELRAAGIHSSV